MGSINRGKMYIYISNGLFFFLDKVFSKYVCFVALFDRREHVASPLCPRLPEGAPQSRVRQQRQAVQVAVCLPEGAVHQHTAPAGSTSTLLRCAPAAITASWWWCPPPRSSHADGADTSLCFRSRSVQMPAGTDPGPGGPEQWGPRESGCCHLCATVPSRRPLPASAVPQPVWILLVLNARRRTHQRLLGLPFDPQLHRSARVHFCGLKCVFCFVSLMFWDSALIHGEKVVTQLYFYRYLSQFRTLWCFYWIVLFSFFHFSCLCFRVFQMKQASQRLQWTPGNLQVTLNQLQQCFWFYKRITYRLISWKQMSPQRNPKWNHFRDRDVLWTASWILVVHLSFLCATLKPGLTVNFSQCWQLLHSGWPSRWTLTPKVPAQSENLPVNVNVTAAGGRKSHNMKSYHNFYFHKKSHQFFFLKYRLMLSVCVCLCVCGGVHTDGSQTCEHERASLLSQLRAVWQEERFIPECTGDGRYNPVQCHAATGYCWCVRVDSGRPLPGTSAR